MRAEQDSLAADVALDVARDLTREEFQCGGQVGRSQATPAAQPVVVGDGSARARAISISTMHLVL